MDRLRLILTITFLESFAAVLVQRGIYFYTEHVLGFNAAENLNLALVVGMVYVVAALSSHRVTARFGERRVLATVITGQLLCLTAILLRPHGAALVIGSMLFNVMLGLKWPIVQSFLSAGKTPKQQATAIGSFNLTWSLAVPLAVMSAGPFVAYWSGGLFVTGILFGGVSLLLLRRFPPRPKHLEHDHPERLPAGAVTRLQALLTSGRWSMLNSYAVLFLLNPLLPIIFKDLGFTVMAGALLAASVDVVRFLTFGVLQRWEGWHGKVTPMVAVVLAMPVGFAMVRFGEHIAWVLGGEVILGLATGMSYYAALYYGMVISNASVDAGGHHEAMIGSGFIIGPGSGRLAEFFTATLIAKQFSAKASAVWGTVVGVGPLVLVTGFCGLWPLRKVLAMPAPNDVGEAHEECEAIQAVTAEAPLIESTHP